LGIAQAFARAGARLSVISRSAERVERAASGLRELGNDAIGIATDVRQPQAVELAFTKAVEKFGSIDVLVSGAAGNVRRQRV
jgi:NAD(P)-dependent dehydrogenase (short-subunit alcohol dehydrogenase family)